MDRTLDPLELRKREEKLVDEVLMHLKVRFTWPQSEVNTIVALLVKLELVNSGLEKMQLASCSSAMKIQKKNMEKFDEIAETLKVPLFMAYNKCINVMKKYHIALKSISSLSQRSQSKVISGLKWLTDIHAHRINNYTEDSQVPLCPLWVMRVLGEGNPKCLVDMLHVSGQVASQLRRHCCHTVRLLARMWWEDGDLVGTLCPAHWVLLDRMVYDGELTLLPPKSLVDQYRQLWSLFHLVQLHGAHHYHLPRSVLPRATANFIHIHDVYNTQGRVLSLICIQRRWYELARLSREALVKRYRWLLSRKGANSDCFTQPHPLYWAVVNAFPSIVLSPLPKWDWLVKNQYVIQTKEQYQMLYGDIPPPTIWQVNKESDNAHSKDDDDVETVDVQPALDRNRDTSTTTTVIDISDDDDDEHKLEIDLDLPVEKVDQTNVTTPKKNESQLNRSTDSTIDSKLLISPVVKLTRIPVTPKADTAVLCDNGNKHVGDVTAFDNLEELTIDEDVPDEVILTPEQLQFVKDNYRPTIGSARCCRVRRTRAIEAFYRHMAATKGLPLPSYTYTHKHKPGVKCKCCCLHLLTRDMNTNRDVRRVRFKMVSLLKDVTPDSVQVAAEDPFYVEDELTDFMMHIKDKSKPVLVIPRRKSRNRKKGRKKDCTESIEENNTNFSDLDLWQREKHKTKQLIAWEKTEYPQKTNQHQSKNKPKSSKKTSLSVNNKTIVKPTDKRANKQDINSASCLKSNNINSCDETNLNKKRKLSDEFKAQEVDIINKIIDANEIENEELDLKELIKGQELIGMKLLDKFETIIKSEINDVDIKNEVIEMKDPCEQNSSIVERNVQTSINKEIHIKDVDKTQENKVIEEIKADKNKEINLIEKNEVKAEFRLKSPKENEWSKTNPVYKNLVSKKKSKEKISDVSKQKSPKDICRKNKCLNINKTVQNENKETNINKDAQLNENSDNSCKDAMLELYLKERMKGRVEFGLKPPKQFDLTKMPEKTYNSTTTKITKDSISKSSEDEITTKSPDKIKIPHELGQKSCLRNLLLSPPKGFISKVVIDLCEDETNEIKEPTSEAKLHHSVIENAAHSSKDYNAINSHIDNVIAGNKNTFRKPIENVLLSNNEEFNSRIKRNKTVEMNDNQLPRKFAKIGPKCFMDKLKSDTNNGINCDPLKKPFNNIEFNSMISHIDNVTVANENTLRKPTETVGLNENQSPRKYAKIGPKSFMNKLKSDTNDSIVSDSIKNDHDFNKNQLSQKLATVGSFKNKLEIVTNETKKTTNENIGATNESISATNTTDVELSTDDELQQNKALFKNAFKASEVDTDSNNDDDIDMDLDILKAITPKKKKRSIEKILKKEKEEAELSILAQKITFESSDEDYDLEVETSVLNDDDECKNDEIRNDVDSNNDINMDSNKTDTKNMIDSKSDIKIIHSIKYDKSINLEPINQSNKEVKVEIKTEVISLTDSEEESTNLVVDVNAINQALTNISVDNTKDSVTTSINDIDKYASTLDQPVRNTIQNVLNKHIDQMFNIEDSNEKPKNNYEHQNITNPKVTQDANTDLKVYAGLKVFSQQSGLKVYSDAKNKKDSNKNVTHPKKNVNVINQNVVQNINIGQANISQSSNSQNEHLSLVHLMEKSDLPICQLEGNPYIVINPSLLKELCDSNKINVPNKSERETNHNINQSTSVKNFNLNQSTSAINQSLNQSTCAINQILNQSTSAYNPPWHNPKPSNMYPIRVTGGTPSVSQHVPAGNSFTNVTSETNVNMFHQQNVNINQSSSNQSTSAINQHVNNPVSNNMYPVRVFGSNPSVIEQHTPGIVMPQNNMNMFQHNNVNVNQSMDANNQRVIQSSSAINQHVHNTYPVRVFASNPTVLEQQSPGSSFLNMVPQNNVNLFQQNNVNINVSQQVSPDVNLGQLLRDMEGNLVLYKLS